jgi:hypothetical protein
LVGKVERRAKQPWVTQEMRSKMDERRKWENVNSDEGRLRKGIEKSHRQGQEGIS